MAWWRVYCQLAASVLSNVCQKKAHPEGENTLRLPPIVFTITKEGKTISAESCVQLDVRREKNGSAEKEGCLCLIFTHDWVLLACC